MTFRESVLALVPPVLAQRVRHRPLTGRLAQGAAWSLIGAIIGRLFTVPVGIVLARLMGREGYGEVGMIYGSLELFGVFGGFGLGLMATKYVAELRTKDPVRAGRIIALSMLTTIVTAGLTALALFALAPWLAGRILAAPHLTDALQVASLLLYLNLVYWVQCAALAGFEAFKLSARLRLIGGVMDLPLILGGLWLGGLSGIFWGAVVSRIVVCALTRRALHSEARRDGIPMGFRGCLQELPVVWRFSVPAVIGGILVAPVNWICATILVNQPAGYSEMGAYNAASQWYNFIVFVPLALASGVLPVLSDRLGCNDLRGFQHVVRSMLRLNLAIALPTAAAISIVSPYVMAIYGPEYRDAWPTLIAVVATGAVFVVLAPVGDVIAASGRMWAACLMNLGWAMVFIVSTMLLVPFGSLGLASARLFAYLIHAVWTCWFAVRLLRTNAATVDGVST